MIIFILTIFLLTILYLVFTADNMEVQLVDEVEYLNDELIWFNFINEHRVSLGLSELKVNAKLYNRANIIIDYLPPVNHHYNGEGYEIVGGGHQTLTALFRHYLNSEKHKEIIEKKNISYIGIGIKKENNKYYNVTLFL